MAAAMAASRRFRDLPLWRLTASTHLGLNLSLRPMSSSAQDEASRAAPSEAPHHNYESLRVTAAQRHILHVQLNRPEKRNAMNKAFWRYGLQILEACL
uniref:Enoyl-CoA hydratase 1 n=1 Tax=Myotis myotis TaxID=51298 RepID=A0A7J7SBH3_MYOMY|nr:enoyl-CoA hydratase 1 [Myotis myotis]